MTILGIETSCDETASAVVKDGEIIRSNVVASSIDIHQKYGGVVPEQAARAQLQSIIPVIHESFYRARLRPKQLDAIAVTVGPGLIGSLLVGVETAKTLAMIWDKPIIPVNHLLAHFYAEPLPPFPFIGLLISGGHTDLIRMTGHGRWSYLGGTRDDAAGEAFDKTARLLNLPYPGGPAIAKYAEHGDPKQFSLPRPMRDSDDSDFSFSGLKTAVTRLTQTINVHERQTRLDLAASIQAAIVDVLATKTLRAAEKYQARNIVVAGGVAANKSLRTQLKATAKKQRMQVSTPQPKLCTDNAVMVARCAYSNHKPLPWHKVQAHPNLSLEM